jgi:hypothetical protein
MKDTTESMLQEALHLDRIGLASEGSQLRFANCPFAAAAALAEGLDRSGWLVQQHRIFVRSLEGTFNGPHVELSTQCTNPVSDKYE